MLILPLLVSAALEPSPIEFVPVVQEVPAAPGKPVTAPKPQVDPQTLVEEVAYPEEALDALAQGKVTARLAVGARGTVTGCTILTGSGSAALDEESCTLFRSGSLRFDPARDAAGRAVASSHVASVTWRLPSNAAPLPLAGGSSLVRYTLAPDGTMTACAVAVSGSVPQRAGGSCAKDNLPYDGVAATWRANTADGPVTIIRRDEFVVGGVPATPPLPLPPGYKVFATRNYDLDISDGGWILGCEPLASEPESTPFVTCPELARYARPAGMTNLLLVAMKVSFATDRTPPSDEQLASVPPPIMVSQVLSPPMVLAPPAPAVLMPPTPPSVPPTPPPPPSPLARPVAPIDPQTWVTSDDYPAIALRGDAGGVVRFVLDVGPTGSPTACTVTGSSGTRLLDDVACDVLMARARFRPALDERGKPRAARYYSRFAFRLPD